MSTFGRVLRQIYSGDRGKLCRAKAGGYCKTGISADGYHMPALNRGRCTCQHHRKAFELAAHDGDIARMIPHAVFLLETDFMGFVDDDQARLRKGQEQRGSRAGNNLYAPLSHAAPDAPALRLSHAAVPCGRFYPEARLEALEKWLRQGDFW